MARLEHAIMHRNSRAVMLTTLTCATAAHFLGLRSGESRCRGAGKDHRRVGGGLGAPFCRKNSSFRVQCGRRQGGIEIAINFGGKEAPAELAMLALAAPPNDNLDPKGIAVGGFQPE
jgi:hypothetical protein